ncbi:MAG: Crp/Fnr family transcriptional regulator [Colwellia sp.]|nr:Crp/Fnr family transcriptional regulator [Colwellia sp.]
MSDTIKEDIAFISFKASIDSYSPLSADTWLALRKLCKLIDVSNNDTIYKSGEIPETFSYVYTGLLRAFICDEKGNEYNKRFFSEGAFPGAMVALLLSQPSTFTIQAMEDSQLILINHQGYRKLLNDCRDLQRYHIQYLEKNWLIKQEKREVSLIQESATQRYQHFLTENPSLDKRIPLFQVASHLGITPTQLSRIRKKLKSE